MNLDNENGEEAVVASSIFSRAVEYLALGAGALSAVLVVFTLGITGYSVFQRYILGRPLTWTDELSGFLVVAIVMLGAAETLRRGEHISVDLISSKATAGKKVLVQFWAYFSTALVAAVLFISGWGAVKFSWDIGVYSDGYLEAPLWIPQSFILIGAGLLFLLSIARIIDLLFFGRHQQ